MTKSVKATTSPNGFLTTVSEHDNGQLSIYTKITSVSPYYQKIMTMMRRKEFGKIYFTLIQYETPCTWERFPDDVINITINSFNISGFTVDDITGEFYLSYIALNFACTPLIHVQIS